MFTDILITTLANAAMDIMRLIQKLAILVTAAASRVMDKIINHA